MVNERRRPFWIYGNLASSHQLDFRGFLLCFSFVHSTPFGEFILVIHRILIDFKVFIIQTFFIIKKSVLAFKNMCPPPIIFFICYVDTHVKSHAIRINFVAICSKSKFNLTGLEDDTLVGKSTSQKVTLMFVLVLFSACM